MFVGQSHITGQVDMLIDHLLKTREGATLLFRGPSGFGKTDLAMRTATALVKGNYQMCIGDSLRYDDTFWVHLIDEVHLLPTPEVLYPKIDSGKYVTLLTTNHEASLQEALENRCYSFYFKDYTDSELLQICKDRFSDLLREDQYKYVIEFCNRNPRILIGTLRRFSIFQMNYGVLLSKISFGNFKDMSETIFGVVDGLDVLCQRYVEVLKSLGGRASLSNIRAALHVDEGTIRAQVEPALMYRNLLQITSKGRVLNG